MRNIPVSEVVLTDVVGKLQQQGVVFKTTFELYKTLADVYNDQKGVKQYITPSIARDRIEQFSIDVSPLCVDPNAKSKSGGRGKKTAVNETVLRQVVADLEAKETFANRSVLYDAVAKQYNEQTGTPISSQTVLAKIKSLGIPMETKAVRGNKKGNAGKAKVQVDREVLTKIVNEVEADENWSGNISTLCQVVAEKYNALDLGPDISQGVVYLRLREFEIETKTKPGKKGPGKKIEVNQEALIDAINQIEGDEGLETGGIAALCQKAAELYNSMEVGPKILPHVIAFRIRKGEISVKTKVSKKGRAKQQKLEFPYDSAFDVLQKLLTDKVPFSVSYSEESVIVSIPVTASEDMVSELQEMQEANQVAVAN